MLPASSVIGQRKSLESKRKREIGKMAYEAARSMQGWVRLCCLLSSAILLVLLLAGHAVGQTGTLHVHVEEVGGAGFAADINVYTVEGGVRDYLTDFSTSSTTGDGSKQLLPGTYDVRIETWPQDKWFEGVVVVAGSETSISQSYGRIVAHVDEVGGAGFAADINVYEADGEVRDYVDDFWTSSSTGDGWMIVLPGVYDVRIQTEQAKWFEGLIVAAGSETSISQSYGRLEALVDEAAGAGFAADINVYETDGEVRDYVDDFWTSSSTGDGWMILLPGVYDVRIQTEQAKWFEGLVVAAGSETSISQSYGRLKAHVNEAGGAGFAADINVYETDGEVRDYVDDFRTLSSTGDGSMILLPGTYDVQVETEQEIWFASVAVTAGIETEISQAYGRITVHTEEIAGAPVQRNCHVYAPPGENRQRVADFSVSRNTGEGSVILLPGTYDLLIGGPGSKWFEGVTIAVGEETSINQGYGRLAVHAEDPSGTPAEAHVEVWESVGEAAYHIWHFYTSPMTGDGEIVLLPRSYDIKVITATHETWYQSVQIDAGAFTWIPGDSVTKIRIPEFLGEQPEALELMEGGERVLTYVLDDGYGNPLPDTSVELNATCVLTNDEGIFSITVDEAALAQYGSPTGQPNTYLFEPVTEVSGYALADPPVVTIKVVPREWQTKWSGGVRLSASVAGLKGIEGGGCEITLHHDDTLTIGIRFEEGAGIAASLGASVSLTSKLKRGASLSSHVLLTHAQENVYRCDDLMDSNQMLTFSGLMLWSVLELGSRTSGSQAPSDPALGFVADALLNVVLPWGTHRTEYTAVGGIEAKVEAAADVQGMATQTFSLLGVPKDVLPWQFLDTGSGAAAELTAVIELGQTEYPKLGETAYFLTCGSELDGYVDLPLDILFPLDALLGGHAIIVVDSGGVLELAYEISSRDGDDVVVDRFTVRRGQDLNVNGIDDLAEVVSHHAVMFTSEAVALLLGAGSALAKITFPGGIVALLQELERVALQVGVPLEYETVCYRDLGDITLDPSVIVGLLVENGLGAKLTLEKETVWLKERGVWFDSVKYPMETYGFDPGLLGDARTLYQMWLDASEPLRDAIWSGIETGVEYVVEDIAPQIPWEICAAAAFTGGGVAGGACVASGAGAAIAGDVVEILGWASERVQSSQGELQILPGPRTSPSEPTEWEGILAVGGFFSLFPQGADLSPPASLALTYEEVAIPVGYDESDFGIFEWDDELGSWLPLPAIQDPITNTLSAEVSSLSTYVVGIDIAPGVPRNVEVGVGESAVTLSWTADAVVDHKGFHVYRSAAETGPFERLTQEMVAATTYLDYPVASGGWYYAVSSVDAAGNESDPSDPVFARVGSTPAVFRVDSQEGVFADQTVHAQSFELGAADIAEWVRVSEDVDPGDVLELDPSSAERYRLSRGVCSSLLAGVVTSVPGVILGTEMSEGQNVRMALVGIVPVKVTDEGGAISPGDLLVASSTPGYAMRWDGAEPCQCALLGKALEPMTQESGVILVLLTAH